MPSRFWCSSRAELFQVSVSWIYPHISLRVFVQMEHQVNYLWTYSCSNFSIDYCFQVSVSWIYPHKIEHHVNYLWTYLCSDFSIDYLLLSGASQCCSKRLFPIRSRPFVNTSNFHKILMHITLSHHTHPDTQHIGRGQQFFNTQHPTICPPTPIQWGSESLERCLLEVFFVVVVGLMFFSFCSAFSGVTFWLESCCRAFLDIGRTNLYAIPDPNSQLPDTSSTSYRTS
jgi:hypothetical protein